MPLYSRRALLRHTLLTAPLLAPLSATLQAFAQVNPSGEQWFWFPTHTFAWKTIAKDTGGTTSWMLVENAPQQGVPFHKHLHEDECFYAIDGVFEITIGDTTITVAPGGFAYGPRNIPHRWTNVGTARGRLLNVFSPAGVEGYFLGVGIPIPNSTATPKVDLAAFEAKVAPLRDKYGIIRTGPFKYPEPSAPLS